MKFLLAILVILFLFWLPWDQLMIPSGSIPDTGAAPATVQGVDASPNPFAMFEDQPVGPCGPRYYIQENDTLRQIAARCGMSLETLHAANATIINPEFIEEGQVITIPAGSTAGAIAAPPAAVIPNTGQGIYIVREGDTLSTIAARYGSTVAQLQAANPQITNPNWIYTGQQIIIPER